MPLLQSINAKRFRTFGEMALDFVKKIRSLVFGLHPLSSISLIDMTFKTLSKRQNGTVDPSLFSLHLIDGRVIPDWKKFISSGEKISRRLHCQTYSSEQFSPRRAISLPGRFIF